MSSARKHAFLVVDDELDVLNSVYDLFRLDYNVLRAQSAHEARTLLNDNEIHLVMTDQRMPGASGVELLADVRNHHPDVVRLLFTGYADLNAVINAINEGQVYRYITKPWDPEELKAIIAQAVEYYELRTERQRLIRELEEANLDLQRASNLKSAFLDIASHELTTPVAVIGGMTDLRRDAMPSGDTEGKQYVDVVSKACGRLRSIVDNMLKLLKAGRFDTQLQFAAFRADELIDSVRSQISAFLETRSLTLNVSIEPAGLELEADRGKLHDAIYNVVMNAIKFSPDGKQIGIDVRQLPDERIAIEVTDEGVGISDKDRPHVLDPFFTSFNTMTHSSGTYEFCKRGLGMGLAIVKKFAEMHDGELTVSQRDPTGTSVRIEMPRRLQSPATLPYVRS